MMSSQQLGKALRNIQSYNSSFKVDIRLYEPLWKYYFSSEEISLEILSLMSELEPFCKEEYTKSSGGIGLEYRKEYLSKFVPLESAIDETALTTLYIQCKTANVAVGKMKEYLSFLPSGNVNLRDYLKQTGLAVLFPRTSSYIFDPKRPVFNQKSTMDGYFSHLAVLNQLSSLSNQLNFDVNNLSSHKYVAHQIAVLYQAVNQVGHRLSFTKKKIEENFKTLKESLSNHDKDRSPKLPKIHKEWINELTAEILNSLTTETFSDQSLRPVVLFLTPQLQPTSFQ